MKKSVGFVNALIGSCLGVGIFFRLRHNSWTRCFLHILCMAILCGSLITWGESGRIDREVDYSLNAFTQVFGEDLKVSEEGIFPGTDPGKSRCTLLSGGGRIYYFPDGKISASPAELEKSFYLVCWAPRGFALAVQKNQGQWEVNSVTAGSTSPIRTKQMQTMNTAELGSIDLTSSKEWNFDDDPEKLNIRSISSAVRSFVKGIFWVQNFLLVLILPWLYTGIFTGMFKLTSRGRYPVRLTTQEFWKVGLYAGLPATLIASAFPALQLPFFDYNLIYMIGLIGYWLYCTGVLERKLAEQPPEEKNDEL